MIETIEDLNNLEAEVKRFLSRISQLKHSEWYEARKKCERCFRAAEMAALKRASLDLSRELVNVRRGPR